MAVRFALLALLCALLPAAHAQVVIYRCTDASGALTVQNGEPCPKGSKQEKRVIEAPPPQPAYVPMPRVQPVVPAPKPAAGPAAEAAATTPRPEAPAPAALAAEERLPPPPIYQCDTWDNDRYLSEDPEPKPRCVRLQTTGLDGDAGGGAGAACEMKYDQCARVPDGAACAGWKQRQREIESTWRYAKAADKAALQEEFARVTRILNDTTCGG